MSSSLFFFFFTSDACVCQLPVMFTPVFVKCDLRIQRLIAAVFHIIDGERRYRQARAPAASSGAGKRDGTLI